MNRKIRKIITVVFVIITVILISNMVFATQGGSALVKGFTGNNAANGSSGVVLIQKIIGPILNAVKIVATGVLIIMIIYLGIKYMAAAPTEKANIKSQLITFTIGAIVVIGTATILQIIEEVVTEVFNIT